MSGRAAWTRYEWENDPIIKYAWVADPKWIKTGSGLWLSQKGGDVASVVPAMTFPTFSTANTPRGFGSLTSNATTDLLSAPGVAAAVSGMQPFTIFVAFQYVTGPAGLSIVASLTNTSDTVNKITVRDNTSAGPPDFLGTAITSNSAAQQICAMTPTLDTAWHVASFALGRVTATSYRVQSSTWDGVNVVSANSGATIDPTTDTLPVTRFNLFGFWGAGKFSYAVRLRAALVALQNMSSGDWVATDRHVACALALRRQVT